MRYKLYCIVPFNISTEQKGIQLTHGVVEYVLKCLEYINGEEEKKQLLDVFIDWGTNSKTTILLRGGGSNHVGNRYTGEKNIGGFDGIGTPESYDGSMEKTLKTLITNGVNVSTFYEPDLNDMLSSIVFIVDERAFDFDLYPNFVEGEDYDKWVESVGGETNAFLRKYLPPFKLA